MLTEKQGYTVAKEVGMRYAPGWDYVRGEEDTSLHVFHTDKMDKHSCWIFHEFFFVDSAQECIERKARAQETRS